MTPPWPGWPRPPLAQNPRDKLAHGVAPRRVSFAGPQASAIWAPRLQRLVETALSAEVALVRNGTLPATLIWAPYQDLGALLGRLDSIGLATAPIRTAVGPIPSSPAEATPNFAELLNYGLLVARSPIEAASTRLAACDPAEIARWLNWPTCCADAWASHLHDCLTDPIAAMLSRPTSDAAPPFAHALLAGLGLGPVRHAPCSAGCRATAAAAQAFIASVAALGLTDEAGWLCSMSSWTIDISLVAGVAEVKTSLFRYAHLSNHLPHRFDLHLKGDTVPEGTPIGLASPFTAPRQPPPRLVRPRSWPILNMDFPVNFAQAGFASAIAMRSRFSTVLWKHTALLRRAVGSAIHLGCGNGLLLELLALQRAGLTLFGVETDPDLGALARQRRCLSAAPLLTATWPEALASLAGMVAPEPLVLFDLEAFGAHSSSARIEIGRHLAGLSATMIAIANDRALNCFGSVDALAAAAELSLAPGRSARVAARVQHTPMEVGAPAA
jgi:hypothetical protein